MFRSYFRTINMPKCRKQDRALQPGLMDLVYQKKQQVF